MTYVQPVEFIPTLIYQYVGIRVEDGDCSIVTRQCATVGNAAREAIKYADEKKLSRAQMRVAKLELLDVNVAKFKPVVDERSGR